MTKQAILAIVVAILIVLGAGGVFIFSQNKPKTETSTLLTSENTNKPEDSITGKSLKEILISTQTSKCTFEVKGDKGNSSGTIYVSGEKARGDFMIEVSGKNSETHMIRNGNIYYMWGDSLPAGIKLTMAIDEMSDKMQGNKDYSSLDPDQKVDFKCMTWTPDSKILTPPSNIKFISIDSMLPNSDSNETTINPSKSPTISGSKPDSTQCDICNALSGEAKTLCQTQLKCQ